MKAIHNAKNQNEAQQNEDEINHLLYGNNTATNASISVNHEPETKHNSQDSEALDILCAKLTNVAVVVGKPDDDFRDVSKETFNEMVKEVTSSQISLQKSGIIKFRRLLAVEEIQHYLDKVIAAPNVMESIVKLLHNDQSELQFEACWVITNIAAGNSKHTNAVVTAPTCVQRLIQLMRISNSIDVQEQVRNFF